MANIKIVSMGPGCIDYLTWEAVQALYCADVMIGAKKYTEIYPEYGILVPEPLISGTIELIKENINKKIAVLVTGDAGFYSLGKAVIKEFGCEGVKVVPGVSIVQFAFAKICEPWENAQFVSLHGRDEELPELNDKFMVLCDNKNTVSIISSKLINMTETHDIYAMEELSMENEKITYIKNEADINSLNGSSLGVVIGIRR